MSITSAVTAVKAVWDIIFSQEQGNDVESKLNDHFREWNKTISNYQGEEITLDFDSITARPMYKPKPQAGGIHEAEAESMFTALERKREKPNLTEHLLATIRGKWITVVRLNISSGDAEYLRPKGMNMSFMSIRLALHQGGHAFRVIENNEIQSDRVEIKIPYTGTIGEYRQKLTETVDLIQYMQDNMDAQAMEYLIRLYHSGLHEDTSGTIWPDEERAKRVGEYIAGGPVDLEELADLTEEIKTNIEEASDSEE